MLKAFFNTQTKSVSMASFVLAIAYFCSAFLGLMRDRILASHFGASRELDIYYAAFKIPDLIATIFIFGAITAAIIPVFSRYLVRSAKTAWEFAANLLNVFLVFLIPLCCLLVLFAPSLIGLIAPGFSIQEKADASLLLRIMFMSPIILGLSNIVSGILQVVKKFLITALAPLLYNLGIIIGVLFFVPQIGLAGLAWGVVLGALMHLLIQAPSFWHSGFRPVVALKLKEPGLVEVLKLMVPRSLGLAASQFNLIVITALASTLTLGAIAVFNLASNLAGVLTNLVSVSVSTAIFPFLSLAFADNKKEVFKASVSLVLRAIIFFLTPLSFLMFILRGLIIKLIYGVGNFGLTDVNLTSACLAVFCFGILAQGLSLILLKAFYAVHNTKTPATITVATVLFNIAASVLLVRIGAVAGFLARLTGLEGSSQGKTILALPFSFSLASLLQLFLLAVFFYREVKGFDVSAILSSTLKIFISSSLMALIVYLALPFLGSLNYWWQFLCLSSLGAFVYIAVSWQIGSSEVYLLKGFLKKHLKIF